MKYQYFFYMSSKQLEMEMVKVAYSQRTYFLLSTTSTGRQVAVFGVVFWTNQKKNTKWRSRICNQGRGWGRGAGVCNTHYLAI